MFAPYIPRSSIQSRVPLPVGLAVRPAVNGDVHAIARMSAQRSGQAYEQCLAHAQRQFDSDTELCNLTVIAELEGNIVGFGRARRSNNAAGDDYAVPPGWYLLGVIVVPEMRRQGIAAELTRFRLRWLGMRASEVFYFANSLNLPSIDLHRKFGFIEIRRPFCFPGVDFSGGGVGVLFRATLPLELP